MLPAEETLILMAAGASAGQFQDRFVQHRSRTSRHERATKTYRLPSELVCFFEGGSSSSASSVGLDEGGSSSSASSPFPSPRNRSRRSSCSPFPSPRNRSRRSSSATSRNPRHPRRTRPVFSPQDFLAPTGSDSERLLGDVCRVATVLHAPDDCGFLEQTDAAMKLATANFMAASVCSAAFHELHFSENRALP